MKARVTVTLKSGVLDPQGKAIEGALSSLGIAGVRSVRQGKLFDLELDGSDPAAAKAALGRACEKLLANTVIETYRIELEPGTNSPAPAARPSPPADDVAPEEAVPAATQEIAASPAAIDPASATESAARDAEMPTEGHP